MLDEKMVRVFRNIVSAHLAVNDPIAISDMHKGKWVITLDCGHRDIVSEVKLHEETTNYPANTWPCEQCANRAIKLLSADK